MIYGFTSSCIYRLDPISLDVKVLIEGDFSVAGPIVGNCIYFAKGHILRMLYLFNR